MKTMIIIAFTLGAFSSFATESKVVCTSEDSVTDTQDFALEHAKYINIKIAQAKKEGFTIVSAPTTLSSYSGVTRSICVTVTKPQ